MSSVRPGIPLSKERADVFARNVDWNLFQVFAKIVEHGGISAAARSMNLRQPSVSAALRRLEDHVGTALCLRSARGIAVTPAGARVLEISRRLQKEIESVPREIDTALDTLSGTVRLQIMSDVVSPKLDRALATFHRHHPGAAIEVRVAPWRSILTALRQGEAEIGIACDSRPCHDLRYLPLMTERQQLYCGADDRRFDGYPPEPSAFRDAAFVLTAEDEPEELERFRALHGLGMVGRGYSETLAEARRMIHLGLGIGFLPLGASQVADSPQGLRPLLPEKELPRYVVYAVAPSGNLSREAQVLLALIANAGDEADHRA